MQDVGVHFTGTRHFGNRCPQFQPPDGGFLELPRELPSRHSHDTILHSMKIVSYSPVSLLGSTPNLYTITVFQMQGLFDVATRDNLNDFLPMNPGILTGKYSGARNSIDSHLFEGTYTELGIGGNNFKILVHKKLGYFQKIFFTDAQVQGSWIGEKAHRLLKLLLDPIQACKKGSLPNSSFNLPSQFQGPS
jgi:hypothetical protein